MDERQALLAAVLAQPEEDTPRLVLADWLDEHGGEADSARAELIRLQCSTTGSEERANELIDRYWRDWFGPLAALAGKSDAPWLKRQWGNPTPLFRRGLLFSWWITPGPFLKKDHQRLVAAGFPILGVNGLSLYGSTKRPELLCQSSCLAWVSSFTWHDARAENNAFAALADCPHFAHLSHLEIEKPRCNDNGLKAIAESSGLGRLRVLGLTDGLWGGKYSARGVLRVLNSPRLPLLDQLNLSDTQPTSFNSAGLFADPVLARLKRLSLGRNTSMPHLARCPYLTGLEVLSVLDSKITDEDAETLASNPALGKLSQLTLYDMNTYAPPLGARAEEVLRRRFGAGLSLKYSVLVRPG